MLRELGGCAPPSSSAAGVRTLDRAAAEAGVVLSAGETVAIELSASERELAGAAAAATAAPAGAVLRWLPPIVENGARHGGAQRTSSQSAAAAVVDVHAVVSSAAGDGSDAASRNPSTRVLVRAHAPGSATLCARLDWQLPHQPQQQRQHPAAAAVLIPVIVYPAGSSPTLAAILDAAAPLPAAAPAAEALRLLEAAVSESEGPSAAAAAAASVLRAFGTFAAALSPEEAHSAADAAQQQAAGPGPHNSSAMMLLHDCVATVAGAVQLLLPSPGDGGSVNDDGMGAPAAASQAEISLEELAAHPYFESRTGAGGDAEAEWLRAVADDYALWASPLLRSPAIAQAAPPRGRAASRY